MTFAEAFHMRRLSYALMMVLAVEAYVACDGDDRHLALANFYQRMVEVG